MKTIYPSHEDSKTDEIMKMTYFSLWELFLFETEYRKYIEKYYSVKVFKNKFRFVKLLKLCCPKTRYPWVEFKSIIIVKNIPRLGWCFTYTNGADTWTEFVSEARVVL